MKPENICIADGCESYKEGRTDYCPRHNHAMRKLSRDLQRQSEKRVVPISKMSRKQVDITARLHEVYEMMDNEVREENGGILVCSAYPYMNEHTDTIDHSHTISRARCHQLGKPELIYDPENIEHCARIPHLQWDDYHPDFCLHANFQKRMDYIKQHDQHDWERRMAIWASVNKPKETV